MVKVPPRPPVPPPATLHPSSHSQADHANALVWQGRGGRGWWCWPGRHLKKKSRGHSGCGDSLQRRFQWRSDVNAACQSLYSIGQQVVRKPEPPLRRCLGFPNATAGLWQSTKPPFCPATWGCALPPQRHETVPLLLLLTFLPVAVKPIQRRSGFTGTAVKAL